MASLNSVMLIGRVGKEPEVRNFEGGAQICTFTLATSEVYTDRQGQRQESTEWHNVVLNGKLSALSQYIHKGTMLYIGGKIRTRQWEDGQGNKRYSTEIVGLSVQLLESKQQNQQAGTAPAPQYQQAPSIPQGQQMPGYVQPPVPPVYQAPPMPPQAPGQPMPPYPGQPGNNAYPPMNSPAYTVPQDDDMPAGF